MCWSDVCKSKNKGGLGIKPLHLWNQAALLKHIWGLVQEKNTLWATWMIKIKLKKLSFWGITKNVDSSWSWRKLLKLRNATKCLFGHRLGDGRKFSF